MSTDPLSSAPTTPPDPAADALAVDRLRFALDAIRREDTDLRARLPRLDVDAIAADERTRELDFALQRRALNAADLQRLRKEYAGEFATLRERANAPDAVEARLREIKHQRERIEKQLQQLQSHRPAESAMDSLKRWGTAK